MSLKYSLEEIHSPLAVDESGKFHARNQARVPFSPGKLPRPSPHKLEFKRVIPVKSTQSSIEEQLICQMS